MLPFSFSASVVVKSTFVSDIQSASVPSILNTLIRHECNEFSEAGIEKESCIDVSDEKSFSTRFQVHSS